MTPREIGDVLDNGGRSSSMTGRFVSKTTKRFSSIKGWSFPTMGLLGKVLDSRPHYIAVFRCTVR